MAVKHGLCVLTVNKGDPGFRNHVFEETLLVFYLEHETNDEVRSKINFLVGQQEPLLTTVMRRKIAWFGHVTSHDSLSQSMFEST